MSKRFFFNQPIMSSTKFDEGKWVVLFCLFSRRLSPRRINLVQKLFLLLLDSKLLSTGSCHDHHYEFYTGCTEVCG